MSYQTLEQRFLARSTEIYNKFSNTSATNPEIKPDSRASRSRIKDDNRSLPVVSTQRDTSRIFNFLKSRDGVLFLSKQLLLQTGNTFAETRLFNPLEIQINSVPFIHAVRHLGNPVKNFTTPTRDKRGALQQETINSFSIKDSNIFTRFINRVTSTALAPFEALSAAPKLISDGKSGNFYMRPEDSNNWFPRLLRSQPFDSRGTKQQTKQYFNSGLLLSRGYANSNTYTINLYTDTLLPKINVFPTLTELSTGPSNTYMSAITKNTNVGFKLDIRRSKLVRTKTGQSQPQASLPDADTVEVASAYNDAHIVNTPTSRDVTLRGQASFYTAQRANVLGNPVPFSILEEKGDGNGYFYGPIFSREIGNDNGENLKTISENGNIRDSYNLDIMSPIVFTEKLDELKTGAVLYNEILGAKEDKSDIIKFIFKSTELDAEPVHFRALISTIKETTKPEYSEQRYIGRTERFVTYAGVKRTANLEFNIVAFSNAELNKMWLRINYLTGLAFPKGASPSGFMIPPLFKITIGGIYEDQPCYVDSLDYDFLDDKITFDIDSEVSQVINVRLSLTLLEKRSKFYNSPFYKVVEELQQGQLALGAQFADTARIVSASSVSASILLDSFPTAVGGNLSEPVLRRGLEASSDFGKISKVPVSAYVNRNSSQQRFEEFALGLRANATVQRLGIEQEISKRDKFLADRVYSRTQDLYGNQPIPLGVFCLGAKEYAEECVEIYETRYLPLFNNGTRSSLYGNDVPVGPPAP